MWRLDCGTLYFPDLNLVSDTFAFSGQSKTLTDSCYLIQHGQTYMLWDTGLGAELIGHPLTLPNGVRFSVKHSLVEQLARIGITPEQISLIAVSHMHGDHTGQAASFPKARLLIGNGDFKQLTSTSPDAVANEMMRDAARLKPWLVDHSPLEAIVGDKDIFGDGSIIMLDTPGHTPGHHVLLVRLPKSGAFVLTGDLIHVAEQLPTHELTPFNTNRADTLASQKRVQDILKNLKATLIIQHEPADIAKLPAFPQPAE
jgi:glyoxylase-like metal-dependent hydrolase (beta-lactamase superfamily II)